MAIKNKEDELYGAALSKAYAIESVVAKSIRIVIGQELYDYIESIACGEAGSNEHIDINIKYAQLCKTLIIQDSDGEYILDYLSEQFKTMSAFIEYGKKAKAFLDSKHNQLRICHQYEVAKKYQQAIKYFEKSGFN